MAEGSAVLETNLISSALLLLFSLYYVFDIAYPKPLYSVYIFIQHFVFEFVDQQKVPNSVTILQSMLAKIE